MKNIKTINVEGSRILLRCDFNVPLDSEGNISDDFRIKENLLTIKYLIENKAKTILISHLGDPDGKTVDNLKLDKVQEKLSELLGITVKKANDCIGLEVIEMVNELNPGDVLLLENLRFHKEETGNDPHFAEELSKLAEVYINDAFSVCHRAHASIVGLPKYLPGYPGFLLEKEIFNLNKVLDNPEKPMVAIIGGKKVGTKAKVINEMSKIADSVIISGLIKKEAIEKNIQFDFPEKITGPLDSLDALDIDEKTAEMFVQKIKTAKTVLWNGPFGKTEDEMYMKGTLAIAKAIIESKAYSVIGGGETIEFLDRQELLSQFSHVCTGGGAMLQYLSGEELPGLKALE
jgi:phosphoglycerate kinase